MRVGNTIWHDGYKEAFTDSVMDGALVQSEEEIGEATLIAVGSTLGDVAGAPTEEDGVDPVPKDQTHSGLIVIR